MIIDILPTLLLFVILFQIEPVRPLSDFNSDYLSIDTTNCFRGVFSIVVLLHHISQSTQGGVIFRKFSWFGYLAVAFFFFLSGYGLLKSYIKKGCVRTGFLSKRIRVVLIPYFFATIIYWIVYAIYGCAYSVEDIVVGIISGEPIVSFSWYIETIVLFYLVFYFLMWICKTNTRLMVVLSGGWYVLYVVFCRFMGYGDWWYISTQLLAIGMFWALYEDRLLNIIEKKRMIIPIVLILFLCFFQFQGIVSYIPFPGNTEIISFVIAILFTISVIFISLKFRIGNGILRFLGSISLEIYLMQGVVMYVFRNEIFFVENDFVWTIVVVVFSVLSGYLLKKIVDLFMKMCKKLSRKCIHE